MAGTYLHTAIRKLAHCMLSLIADNTRRSSLTCVILASFTLNACDNAEIKENVRKGLRDPIDREADVTFDEFKDAMRPLGSADKRAQKKDHVTDESDEELDFSPVILSPEEPEIKSAKLLSLSITPDVQIKDVLLEVGRQAKLDMAIDPNIGEGGIYLSVKDRPVGDVIKMICTLAELKYDIEDSVLKVERDRPYLENYAVDFINLVRSTSGSVNTSTNVLSISTGGSGGSSGLSSGSNNNIKVTSDGDLWKSIDDNLKQILSTGSLPTTAQTDDSGQPDTTANNANSGSSGDNQTSLTTNNNQGAKSGNSKTTGRNSNTNNTARQNANSQSRSGNSSNKTNLSESDSDLGGYYTINKQAGIISVMATQKKHRAIQKYLEQIKKSLSSQVLIEAKVLEVSLSDQYGSGISWQDLVNTANGKVQTFDVSGGSTAGSDSPLSSPALSTGIFSNILTFSGASPIGKQRLKYIADLIQHYGTTRALSNPRITALNNQQAVLTFAVNKPYYTVTITAATTTSNSTGNSQSSPPTATSTVHSVPIGVILTLYPLIHMDTGEVTLNIRPTISTDTNQYVPDPAISILAAGLASTSNTEAINTIKANNKGVPTVQVRELDTVLKIKSGDVIVLGGLIQNTDQNVDSGIPFLSKIPILGNLAKKTYKSTTVKETVILLQATILSSDGYTHEHDRKLYNTLAQDPRPITF